MLSLLLTGSARVFRVNFGSGSSACSPAPLVDLQLILPLDGKIDANQAECDVSRLESETAIWCDGGLVGKHALVIREDLHRAGFLHAGWRLRRNVAARREYRHLVERVDENLMRVDAAVDDARLWHFDAQRAVCIDRPYREPRRRVVMCRQQIAACVVCRNMHRPLEEKYWVAEFRERAGFLVDAERADALFAKRAIGSNGAPGHIEHAMIGRWPRILNVSGQCDGADRRQRRVLHVELVLRQHRTDRCVQDSLSRS